MELSNEVKQVESHLTWIDQFFKLLSANFKPNRFKLSADSVAKCKLEQIQKACSEWDKCHSSIWTNITEDRLQLQQQEQQEGTRDGENSRKNDNNESSKDRCCDQRPLWAEYLSVKLITAGMGAYVGDFNLANQQLKQVRKILDQLTGIHKERLLAVSTYAVEALEWSMGKMQKQDEKSSTKTDKGKSLLLSKCLNLNSDDKSWAVIKFFKGSIERNLCESPENEKDVKYFEMLKKEVLRLDPDYFMWYHYAIVTKRNWRRLKYDDRLEDYRHIQSSEEEEDWCKMVVNLAPDIMTSNFDYGMLMMDELKFAKGRYGESEKQMFNKSLLYLSKALDLAEKNDLKIWIPIIKKKKGELLARWGEDMTRVDEGLNMLYSCLESDPNNPKLMRKLAMVYESGAKIPDNDYYPKDVVKAGEFYRKALEFHQSKVYYQCLRDYLKVARLLPQPPSAQEILELLTKSVDVLKVQTTPGTPYWIIKTRIWITSLIICDLGGEISEKRAACKELNTILNSNPNLEVRNMLNAFKNPPFSKPEKVMRLAKLKDFQNILDKGITAAIGTNTGFSTNAIQSMRNLNVNDSWSYGSGRGRSSRTSSEADNDNCWRKK